jgi:gluconate 5-dehydrogenase
VDESLGRPTPAVAEVQHGVAVHVQVQAHGPQQLQNGPAAVVLCHREALAIVRQLHLRTRDFDARTGAGVLLRLRQPFQRLGKVDILVNNAGATWGAPAEEHPLEAWDKLVNVNLTGVFVLTQLIGRKSMIPAKWGRIVNVASIAGLMGQDPRIVRTIAYNATKGGLVNFTRALAAEWGEHGITVNAICPGFFPSRMTRATLGTTGELIREWTPTKRLGNDEDLKGLAVLLASEASRHITGQAIAVDGGATVI